MRLGQSKKAETCALRVKNPGNVNKTVDFVKGVCSRADRES